MIFSATFIFFEIKVPLELMLPSAVMSSVDVSCSAVIVARDVMFPPTFIVEVALPLMFPLAVMFPAVPSI